MKNLFFFRFVFKNFALLIMFVGFLLSLNTVVYGQYNTYILPTAPYQNYGCPYYYQTAIVHKVNDFIGVTTNPPPVLATFTGGRPAGSYFQSCLGMVGYITSRKDRNGRITTLPNKIDVNFHKAVKFISMAIQGKYPQRVRVTILDFGGNPS